MYKLCDVLKNKSAKGQSGFPYTSTVKYLNLFPRTMDPLSYMIFQVKINHQKKSTLSLGVDNEKIIDTSFK